MNRSSLRHLAIRAPNWVGDLVMSTPVLDATLADRRFERVSVLVRRALAPVLAGALPPSSIVALAAKTDEIDWLEREKPDAVMLLSNSFGAAWRAFAARVPIRAGSALSGRRWLLTHAFVPPTRGGRRAPIPTAHLLRDVAGLLGVSVASLHPRLCASEIERADSRAMLARFGLARDQAYVVCSPGAAFGAAKLWSPDRFAAALDLVFERRGWRGVVSGGPGEEALIDAVARATRSGAISLAAVERDLGTLRPLIAGARLVLVGDSGPRWYAAAFDVPCVCVMGPTFPEITASSLELCEVVRVELECSPCLQRSCPLAHHRCMNDITVERVVAAAETVLERARSSAAASRERSAWAAV
jgi:heptosyltransferase-2